MKKPKLFSWLVWPKKQKTDAEKSKNYRMTLKLDEDKYEAHKENEKARVAAYRVKRTPEQKLIDRERKKESQRRFR